MRGLIRAPKRVPHGRFPAPGFWANLVGCNTLAVSMAGAHLSCQQYGHLCAVSGRLLMGMPILAEKTGKLGTQFKLGQIDVKLSYLPVEGAAINPEDACRLGFVAIGDAQGV